MIDWAPLLKLLLAGMLLHPLPATAQSAAPSNPDQTVSASDIIVRGVLPEQRQANKRAVGKIAKPVPTGGFEAQYARWDHPVCVALAGLPAAWGQSLVDRISQVARDIGIDAQGPGCRPDIYIVFTGEPRQFVDTAVGRSALFSGASAADLERLRRNEDPVRWAGVSGQVGSQGDPVFAGDAGSNSGNGRTLKMLGSRIVAPTKTLLQRIVVIVDSKSVVGVGYDTIGAYLAMVTLAQLRPNADAPMVNTILSAFRDRDHAPHDLTGFDAAYLKALYAMPIDAYGARQRQSIISSIDSAMKVKATSPSKP